MMNEKTELPFSLSKDERVAAVFTETYGGPGWKRQVSYFYITNEKDQMRTERVVQELEPGEKERKHD